MGSVRVIVYFSNRNNKSIGGTEVFVESLFVAFGFGELCDSFIIF